MDEESTNQVTESQRWEKYLRDRLIGNNIIRVDSIDTIQLVPVTKERIRRSLGMWPAPEIYARVVGITAAATLALTLTPATLGATEDGLDLVRQGIDWSSDRIFGVPTITVERTRTKTVEETRQINRPVSREVSRDLGRQAINGPGEFVPDVNLVNQISGELNGIIQDRGTILQIDVVGTSSDEWGLPEQSLGVANQENVELAQRRANEFASAIQVNAAINGTNLPTISAVGKEAVLDRNDLATLNDLVAQVGYDSTAQLLNEYKQDPNSIPPAARDFLDIKLGKTRGVTISVKYLTQEMKVEEITVVVPVKVTERYQVEVPNDTKPENPNHDFDLNSIWLIPPPLPLLRRKREEYTEEEERIISEPIEDRAWVKLYPEALREGNTLDKDAWQWTRKYQRLMKDDRIQHVLRFDYTDESGEPQTLRVAFIDHEPSTYALAAVERTLKQTCKMHGGKIAERLGLIAIFPEDSAGPQIDAQKIGLGIDEQYPSGVLGVATPAIGLIELHMDLSSPEAIIRSFEGMEWTLAHEISHFADVENRPMKLHPIVDIPNGYYSSNPWSQNGIEMYITLASEGHGSPKWNISVPFYDETGQLQLETITCDRLPENFATWGEIRKMGFPTRYSTTHETELYAETGAATITGIPIPFSEHAPNGGVPDSIAAEQAGYRPDPRARKMFAESVGANPTFNPVSSKLTWSIDWDPESKVISGVPSKADRKLAGKIRDAKSRNLPEEDDFINVLAGVRPSERQTSRSTLEITPSNPAIAASSRPKVGLSR